MKPSSPAFIVYLIASFFAVIGIALNNDFLVLLSKPIIVPSIFFYYLQIKKTKINWLFTIAVLFSFIADMIILFELQNGDVSVALLNIGMYLIFLYLSVKEFSYKSMTILNFPYFIIIVFAFMSILCIMLDLMTNLDSLLHNLFVFYGIILSLLASVIVFNHLKNFSLRTFYALIMCICFVTSDVFFALYNFYLKMAVFTIFNVTVQFASYYYMIKYFTSDVVNREIEYER